MNLYGQFGYYKALGIDLGEADCEVILGSKDAETHNAGECALPFLIPTYREHLNPCLEIKTLGEFASRFPSLAGYNSWIFDPKARFISILGPDNRWNLKEGYSGPYPLVVLQLDISKWLRKNQDFLLNFRKDIVKTWDDGTQERFLEICHAG